MSSSSVEKIKEALDIDTVLGGYMKLDKVGGNFKGKCPFHNEKTPSFFVSPSRGTYYCFGCGAKGDIFTFVQEFEGLDFVGSLKFLAEKAGVTLEDFAPQKKEGIDSLSHALERATVFFEHQLSENKSVVEYLLKRGLTAETIKDWRIGFVKNEWRTLSSALKAEGFKVDVLLKAGLVKKTDKAGEQDTYDVFRGRIIFPIFDTSGKPVAFSGRIFEETPEAPKYLNSPETVLFNKSETLYGLHKAKVGVRKKDYSILVEGQMDLLMCHQAGFDNAVASSGTAFTEAHLLKLKRLSNRIIFVFDGDDAGFGAAIKSSAKALALGFEVKLAELPEGMDPADLILKDLEAWKEAITASKHLIDFHLDKLLSLKLDNRQLAKEVQKKILPHLVNIESSIEQSHFVSQISKRTGIREEAIWDDLRKIPRGKEGETLDTSKDAVEVEVKKRKNYIERRLYGIIFWQEGLPENSAEKIDTEKIRLRLILFLGDKYLAEALKEFEKEKTELIFEAESYYGEQKVLVREVEELISNFEEDILREKFAKSMNELTQVEREGDEKRAKELLIACQEIGARLSELSKEKMLGSG